MNRRDDRAIMDAMLRHLGCGQDLADFPGTASEKLALVRTAGRRGLIAWRKGRGRFELTSIGWSALTPRRRFTLAAVMSAAAIGATIGAVAQTVLWLPVGASHRSIRVHSTALASHLEAPIAARAVPPAEVSVRSPAPAQPAPTSPDPASNVHDPEAGAGLSNPIEPEKIADQPVSNRPLTDAAPTGAKRAAVKKSRHTSARRHRKEQTNPTWAYAEPWRVQQFSYSRYGGQGSWLGYR